MIRLHMTRAESPMWVSLRFPATPADVGLAFARLDQISTEDKTVLKDVDCSVPSLHQYLMGADPNNGDDLTKLNRLAEKIENLTPRQCDILAGAVKAESINGLDDVLHIADRVDAYIIVPNVTSDAELGRFVAVSSQLHDDPRFPEESWPYLDYSKIGAEYYANLGGAYTAAGYVLHKDAAELRMDRKAWITLQLTADGREITLNLPAAEQELNDAKAQLGIDSFAQAHVREVTYGAPYLDSYIPLTCFSVEGANELAEQLEQMETQDGGLLKYLAVLEVMQPETLGGALQLACSMDDYERITVDAGTYGKEMLRRMGAEQEMLDALEGYTDFKRLGEDLMQQQDVRQTEFGLVRRCREPSPEKTFGMQMGGI